MRTETSSNKDTIRVLLTRSRLDPHDRGTRYLARKLMEAGMEVIYTKYLRPEDIIASAMEEDVDVIGISFYTTSPRVVIEKVMTLVNENNMEKTLVTVGGIIPEDDIPKLIEAGAGQAFGPGSLPEDIIKYIQAEVKTRKHP